MHKQKEAKLWYWLHLFVISKRKLFFDSYCILIQITCITHIIQFCYIWHGVIDLDRADRINSSLATTTALHHGLTLGREGQGNEWSINWNACTSEF